MTLNPIAQFMGFTINNSLGIEMLYNEKTCRVLDENKLQYDSSWEWLMEVVDKIEKIGVSIDIRGFYNVFHNKTYTQTTIDYTICKTVTKTTASDEVVLFKYHSDMVEDKFKSVYQAVVKFIEWYNTQPKV